jgi:hypothetical protein
MSSESLTPEEAQLVYRVLDTLSQKIGAVAPGAHHNFYSEYNEAWGILQRCGAKNDGRGATP